MKIASIPGVIVLLALCSSAASAQQGPEAAPATHTRWQCWVERVSRILCQLETAGPDLPPAAADLALTVAVTPPSGRTLRLPPLVAEIRESPSRLQQRTIAIPILGAARSRRDAEELADAVLCAGRGDCQVMLVSAADAYLNRADDPALSLP